MNHAGNQNGWSIFKKYTIKAIYEPKRLNHFGLPVSFKFMLAFKLIDVVIIWICHIIWRGPHAYFLICFPSNSVVFHWNWEYLPRKGWLICPKEKLPSIFVSGCNLSYATPWYAWLYLMVMCWLPRFYLVPNIAQIMLPACQCFAEQIDAGSFEYSFCHMIGSDCFYFLAVDECISEGTKWPAPVVIQRLFWEYCALNNQRCFDNVQSLSRG